MLLTGGEPSGGLDWLALSLDGKAGGAPPARPPDWAWPRSASLPNAPCVPLSCWRFQVSSVNPRLYDQSCMRLCWAKRFAMAASMSFCAGLANTSGLHFAVNHWLVHG